MYYQSCGYSLCMYIRVFCAIIKHAIIGPHALIYLGKSRNIRYSGDQVSCKRYAWFNISHSSIRVDRCINYIHIFSPGGLYNLNEGKFHPRSYNEKGFCTAVEYGVWSICKTYALSSMNNDCSEGTHHITPRRHHDVATWLSSPVNPSQDNNT